MSRVLTKKIFLASAMITGLLLSGCSSPEAAPPEPEKSTSEAEISESEQDNQDVAEISGPEPEPTESGGDVPEQDDMEAALAEREQFHKDQQLPLDGSLLSASTPEQQQFVDEQRAHIEAQGGAWSPELENLTLALTGNACETAILNHHDADASTVESYIASSPLIMGSIPESLTAAEREQAEASMAEIAVYGMQYMCPADYEQWRDAVVELYPEHINTVP